MTAATSSLAVIAGAFAGMPWSPIDPGIAAAQTQLQSAYSASVNNAGTVRPRPVYAHSVDEFAASHSFPRVLRATIDKPGWQCVVAGCCACRYPPTSFGTL